jgi:hypothetical protein
VKWKSPIWNGKIEIRSSTSKADANLKSCLFRLSNPDKISGRRFVLKVEKIHDAINCESGSRPNFRDFYCDVGISDICNTNVRSLTINFDSCSTNDTGLSGNTFFRIHMISSLRKPQSSRLQDHRPNSLSRLIPFVSAFGLGRIAKRRISRTNSSTSRTTFDPLARKLYARKEIRHSISILSLSVT